MNRPEIETVLFRLSAAYPAATTATQATVDEWLDSALVDVDFGVALAAVARWKETQDRPPVLRQFLATCGDIAREEADVPHMGCAACDDGWVTDHTEEGATYLRPCNVCRPELYDRWQGGHMAPGHECPACRGPALHRRKPRQTERVRDALATFAGARELPPAPPPDDNTEALFQ